MEFTETWWKCPNDALFVKKLSLEFWKCIIVMFQLAHDFTYLAYQWLFLCATCLDSEPLHFAWKSVEIFHASLCRWSLKNKLTLDMSGYIWKSSVGDTSCCNFFLIVNCYIIVPKFWKRAISDGIHWNLVKMSKWCIVCEKT